MRLNTAFFGALVCAAACGDSDSPVAPAGQGGSSTACSGVDSCPGSDDACREPSCDEGVCGYTDAPIGTPCGTDQACDGEGSCVDGGPSGTSCDDATDCVSGECTDGVCCVEACDGACESCALEGSVGTCTPYEAGTDPENECGATGTCADGGGCAGSHVWSHGFPAGGSGLSRTTVDIDDDGRVIVAGFNSYKLDFGGGPLGVGAFMASFGEEGTVEWAKYFAALQSRVTARSSGTDVVLAAFAAEGADLGGGALSAGHIVAKFDAAGNLLWTTALSGAFDLIDLAIASDGSIGMAVTLLSDDPANFGGGTLLSAGSWDTVVVKFNSDGDWQWNNQLGDSDSQNVQAISAGAAGGFTIAGNFAGSIPYGGGTLTASGTEHFVMNLDANGDVSSAFQFPGASGPTDEIDVALDGSGNLLVAGDHNAAIDFGSGVSLQAPDGENAFVLKLTSAGTPAWARSFGGAMAQNGRAIACDDDDNVLVTGQFANTIDLGTGELSATGDDAFIARLSADGTPLWGVGFGTDGVQSGRDIATTDTGRAVVVGTYENAPDFGGGAFPDAKSIDSLFIAVYAP